MNLDTALSKIQRDLNILKWMLAVTFLIQILILFRIS
jgi:hypothetical protein